MKYFNLLILAVFAVSPIASTRIVCYWQRRMDASLIDPHMCTHIILAFVNTNATGAVYANTYQDQGLIKLSTLREQNPNLKLMVAVADNFKVISQNYRAEFAQSMTDFLIKYDLDGADIDWEYPAVADTENFILLLQALRNSLKEHNKDLSVAVNPCGSASIGYDVPRIFDTVDFVNGMFYDFFSGKWNNNTANHGNNWNSKSSYSVISCRNKFIEKGAIPEKFVIGIPAYSRNFQLDDADVNGVGALATFKDFGLPGQIPATFTYAFLCQGILEGTWTRRYDTLTSTGPYAFSGTTWAGYDDAESVREKSQMVLDSNLGGVMFWSLDHDDYLNICGDGIYPLVRAASKIILR